MKRSHAVALGTLPAALFLLVALYAAATNDWAGLFASPFPSHPYLDLAQVTATADCVDNDNGWSIASDTCDPYGRGYNYPSIWARLFALLGLGSANHAVIGIVFIALLAASILALTLTSLPRRQVVPHVALMLLAACSPPVFFLAERGNIEIIVFSIVTASAVLYKMRLRTPAALGLAAGVLGKLFPIFSAPMLLTDGLKRKTPLVVFAIGSAVALTVNLSDLPYISARTPMDPFSSESFGATAVPAVAGAVLGFSQGTARVLGIALFIAATALYVALAVRNAHLREMVRTLVKSVASNRTSSILLLAGGGAMTGAYLMGNSSNYRLIWLLPVAAALSTVRGGGTWPLRGLAVLTVIRLLIADVPLVNGLLDLAIFPTVTALVIGVGFHCVRHPRADS